MSDPRNQFTRYHPSLSLFLRLVYARERLVKDKTKEKMCEHQGIPLKACWIRGK